MANSNLASTTVLRSTQKDLAQVFFSLSQLYTMEDDMYRANAFETVAVQIHSYDGVITSSDQVAHLRGVGSSSVAIIDEWFKSGRVERLEKLREKYAHCKATIDQFQSCHGIGPVAAAKFYAEGHRSLQDLLDKATLTDAQRIGLQWHDDLAQKINRDEIQLMENLFRKLLTVDFVIAGSYRRGEPQSGDIDVLVKNEHGTTMESILTALSGFLPATLASGPTKFMGVIQLPGYIGHRIDIRLIGVEQWACALLYFTGSQRFNILLRRRAQELGLRLNEYGLYDESELEFRPEKAKIQATSEKAIFEYLGVAYLTPEQRTRDLQELEIVGKRVEPVEKPVDTKLKDKFYANPHINPRTGRVIKVGGPTYNALVKEFGKPTEQ
jgi:DNA polymerase/3'-5' exonuclease PolX